MWTKNIKFTVLRWGHRVRRVIHCAKLLSVKHINGEVLKYAIYVNPFGNRRD